MTHRDVHEAEPITHRGTARARCWPSRGTLGTTGTRRSGHQQKHSQVEPTQIERDVYLLWHPTQAPSQPDLLNILLIDEYRPGGDSPPSALIFEACL